MSGALAVLIRYVTIHSLLVVGLQYTERLYILIHYHSQNDEMTLGWYNVVNETRNTIKTFQNNFRISNFIWTYSKFIVIAGKSWWLSKLFKSDSLNDPISEDLCRIWCHSLTISEDIFIIWTWIVLKTVGFPGDGVGLCSVSFTTWQGGGWSGIIIHHKPGPVSAICHLSIL